MSWLKARLYRTPSHHPLSWGVILLAGALLMQAMWEEVTYDSAMTYILATALLTWGVTEVLPRSGGNVVAAMRALTAILVTAGFVLTAVLSPWGYSLSTAMTAVLLAIVGATLVGVVFTAGRKLLRESGRDR